MGRIQRPAPNSRRMSIKLYYISKAPKHGVYMFWMGALIPIVRITIRRKINFLRHPRHETTFNRNLHRIPVEQLKQVREFELRSSEIVEQDDGVGVISIEPRSTGVNVDVLRIIDIIEDRSRLACSSSTPINDNTAHPIAMYSTNVAISQDTALVLEELSEMFIRYFRKSLAVVERFFLYIRNRLH